MSAAIKTNGLTAEQRLQVYRNNTQLGLTEALRDGYPVVNKLVGNDFFNHLARSYIRSYPPQAGCLMSFGGQFDDFIAGFKPADGLPYLPDVARLEWFWHEAFHEADASSLALPSLAGIAPETYGKLLLTLHPSSRLLVSDFPVLSIWQSNQDDCQGDIAINLNEGSCQLLVFRPEWEVLVIALDKSELCFINAVAQGSTLIQAAEQAIALNSAFDLFTVLHRSFGMGLFTDYSITQEKD